MNPGLRRGVRAVSWTRVLPPRVRQGPLPLPHGLQQARGIQIRSVPGSEQPGDYLPIANTPNSADSSGMSSVFCCEASVAIGLACLCGIILMPTGRAENRCAVRCCRRPIFVTVGFAFSLAESLYSTRNTSWIEWKAG